jgi:hypothetical protein
MATSRSSNSSAAWTAGVRLFSGRPDPQWELAAAAAARVEELWRRLQRFEGVPPAPPALGYRGCFACEPSGNCWDGYRGAVTLSGPEVSEMRHDGTRAFERFVLGSAPPGVLPANILELAELTVAGSA